jgi:hypothetical protein
LEQHSSWLDYSDTNIPNFRELKQKRPVEIRTGNGTVGLFPFTARRGSASQKWALSIDGSTLTKVAPMMPCFVRFGGDAFGGEFTKVTRSSGVWHVTFEILSPNARFWEDSA